MKQKEKAVAVITVLRRIGKEIGSSRAIVYSRNVGQKKKWVRPERRMFGNRGRHCFSKMHRRGGGGATRRC